MKKATYGSRKKYHYLYKTLNLKNRKVYYGMHSTDNIEDGYIGSGTYLRRSIKKYGKENFKIEILKYFDTRDELAEAEKEIITEEMVKDINCYNLKPGGSGGFTVEQAKNGRRSADRKLKEKYGEDFRRVINKRYWGSLSNEDRNEHGNKIKQAHKKMGFNYNTFGGRLHTKETKEKMSLAKKGKHKGENNSQFGTCWITNGKESKKMYKGNSIPKGWRLGRICKK